MELGVAELALLGLPTMDALLARDHALLLEAVGSTDRWLDRGGLLPVKLFSVESLPSSLSPEAMLLRGALLILLSREAMLSRIVIVESQLFVDGLNPDGRITSMPLIVTVSALRSVSKLSRSEWNQMSEPFGPGWGTARRSPDIYIYIYIYRERER